MTLAVFTFSFDGAMDARNAIDHYTHRCGVALMHSLGDQSSTPDRRPENHQRRR